MGNKQLLDIIFKKNPQFEFLSCITIDKSNEIMGVTIERHSSWDLVSNELLEITYEDSPEGISVISYQIKTKKEKKSH